MTECVGAQHLRIENTTSDDDGRVSKELVALAHESLFDAHLGEHRKGVRQPRCRGLGRHLGAGKIRLEEVGAVTPAARERLAGVLGRMDGGGAFSSQRSVPPGDLHIEVRGVGPLEFPVPEPQARELCAVARPASFGRGTETLLDCRVRDTWEVPKSRVKIDQRRWNKALVPVLDGLRADLGLPDGSRLKARFHSLLVYASGQFFKPHLDSEKDDSMVGSLVVTLPSTFQGGALVVDHAGKRATYRRLAKNLSCVAFYADCDHEIRPVKSGHRIVLTYDLVLEGDQVATAPRAVESADTDALMACLDQHFSTAPAPRWQHDQRPSLPPNRLVLGTGS